jgi:anti-anti-sigma factor
MPDDQFPVEWTGRQAIVACPEHVDVANVNQLRDRLLSVISRGPAVLVADMTGTRSCDHAAVDAIARACQRAAVNGTQFRLVVATPVIRRVLGIEGLDRLVPIYPSREAEAGAPTPGRGFPARPPIRAPQPDARLPGSTGDAAPAAGITPAVLWHLIDALGDGLALTGEDGTIALVNRRCAGLFGYQREQLIGLPVDSLVPPDVRAAHHGYRVRYTRAPQPRPMGERVRLAGLRKGGATFPVEISLSPVPTTTEKFVLAVVRDATQTRWRDDLANPALGVAADQSRSTKDLLDRVTQRSLQVGLSLQATADISGTVARERFCAALDQLDDAIHEMRDYAFSPGAEGPPGTVT